MTDLLVSTESFSKFSTSSPANSLPVNGTLLRQNKGASGAEKTEFKFFLSELVCTYDNLNIYAKENFVAYAL